MSASLSEFLCAWNETMVIQIREADIKNPSEPIFRRWLITLLKEFYVDTQSFENMDNESGNRLRALRVKLVATVNHHFKIACSTAKQEFVYLDLIQPTYRRTYNILNYLLNYCVFVRHTYKTTILDLKDKLQERDQLRTTKNQLRTEIETAKIKEENNIKMIKEFETKIPKLRNKIKELEEKLENQKEELADIQIMCEKFDLDLIEKKNELSKAKTRAVSDQEVDSIVSAMDAIQKQLEEQEHITATGRQKLKEHSRMIEEAQAITAKMEKIQSSFKMNADDMKTQKKTIESLSNEIEGFKSSITKLKAEFDSLTQAREMKKKVCSELLLQRNEIRHDDENANLSNDAKILAAELQKLTIQENALNNEQKRLIQEFEVLYRIASSAMKHISKKVFEYQD